MKKHLSVKALLMGIVLTILKILNDYPLYNWKRIIGFAFFSILIFITNSRKSQIKKIRITKIKDCFNKSQKTTN